MDPITAIGLLASISNLLGASKGVIKLMKTFKDGEKELAELVSCVSLFEENLKGFDRVFRSRQMIHRVSVDPLTKTIEESSRTLADLERRLLQICKSESSTIRRMRWVQHKSSLEKFSCRIRSQCAMLHSLVSVAQIQNPQLLGICSSVAEGMEWSSLPLKSTVTNQRSPDSQPLLLLTPSDTTFSESFSLGRLESTGSFPGTSKAMKRGSSHRSLLTETPVMSRLGSLATERRFSDVSAVTDVKMVSSRSSTSSGESSDFSLPSSAEDSSILASEDSRPELNAIEKKETRQIKSLVIRRACRFDCYCHCHPQSVVVSNDVFAKFNAPIFRTSTMPKVECTEPDCVGAIQYRVLPANLFKRALSHLMSSQRFKFRYNLNTYRMVPEGSDAMRYVKHGNLEKLKMAITTGEATPWDTAPDGWSLLHTAVYARQLPTVRYLCDIGADIDVADLGARLVAIMNSPTKKKRGAKANYKKQRKPVDLAILKSLTAGGTKIEKEIARILNYDDYLTDFEFTPVHIAVLDLYDPSDSERPDLGQLIEFIDIANNASPGTNWVGWKPRFQRRSPLFMDIIDRFRVSTTHKVIHNFLDQKDCKFHWTPLHWASATNRADKMKILIQNGADPFIQSNLNANIIHAAVESNALESLTYALKICKCYPEKLDINQPNVWGESPLIMAAQGCLVNCVRLLLEAGADRNVRQENQQVALHYAGLSARSDARRETAALLANEEDALRTHINSQDEDGRPPIFDFLDDLECMELLICHGARLDLFDNFGRSIFHHVCIQDENKALKALLRLYPGSTHAILKAKDHNGNTALIEALRHGSMDCAMTLLRLENIGDMTGQDGWAAVHYAAKLGNPDLLEMTFNHPNFQKGVRTADGKTIEVIAMESGNWCGRAKDLVRKFNSII
ncbi:hypothetical protein PRK78_002931 [Emydomyces testavorans]|uniref:Ankyrin n=1 Tax=Emydomyces testavorans TaxID=2070801 RepID=A0AAF0IK43_9EURO|nr:hypothetical protein PRK78_002931 [Emydomyces testavorans]